NPTAPASSMTSAVTHSIDVVSCSRDSFRPGGLFRHQGKSTLLPLQGRIVPCRSWPCRLSSRDHRPITYILLSSALAARYSVSGIPRTSTMQLFSTTNRCTYCSSTLEATALTLVTDQFQRVAPWSFRSNVLASSPGYTSRTFCPHPMSLSMVGEQL